MSPQLQRSLLVAGPWLLLVATLAVGLTGVFLGGTAGALGYAEVDPIGLAAPEPAVLQAVSVNEGDSVRAGDILATFDTRVVDAEIAVAEANSDLLRAEVAATSDAARATAEELSTRLAEIDADRAAVEGEVRALSAEAERRRDWTKQGLAQAEALAEVDRNLDAARAKLAGLQAAADTVRAAVRSATSRSEASAPEVDAAARALAVAEREADALRARREQLVLRAPVDGKVATIWFRAGAAVPGATAVIDVVADRTRRVVACLTEREAGALFVGSPAVIHPLDDSGAIDATVTGIGAMIGLADERCRTILNRTEYVRPVYLAAPASLPAGMRVTVRFPGGGTPSSSAVMPMAGERAGDGPSRSATLPVSP